MIRGSESFEAIIKGSHAIAVKCEAWLAGRRIASDLPLREDASISVDSARFVRRQGKFSFVEETAKAGETLRSILARPGCELRVWRGVRYLDGRAEYLPIHWGLVDMVDGAWPSKTLQVDSPDQAQRIAYDGFPVPRQASAGFTVSQSIQQYAGESIPRLRFADSTGDTTPVRPVVWDQGSGSRSTAVDKLAVSIGAETFASPDGRWVLRPVATLLGIPMLMVREGQALISAADKADWSKVKNDMTVTCERADGTKLLGRSIDNDSASDTWVDGPLGRRTGGYQTSLATTVAQCNVIAASLRARMQGAQVSVDFETLVHPGTEAGDRADVTHDRATSRLIIDSFELGVFAATMRAQGRLQVVPEGVE